MPTAPQQPYLTRLTLPAETFHEPRRDDCPWCGSDRLDTLVRMPDPARRTPGTFVLETCRACAHVFQNPRLTADALALYPRRPYGGHGGARRRPAAARAVPPAAEPESWLDVGTGYGHFPEAAREVHPYTCFDGLDTTPRVQHARAAGRVEEAHQGELTDPEITARLRGRYDVVSMFHHLEHTSDPREELRAALAVLRPGGHLLIELPDPGCAFGALLGRRWAPYDQPRRLHLLPPRNVLAELEAAGCTIVTVDRSGPHVPYDLTGAVSLALARRRTAPALAVRPVLAAATALDRGLAPLLRRTRFSNACRVLARKPGSAP